MFLPGLGECYVQLERAAISSYFHGRALEYCSQALLFLSKYATHSLKHSSCGVHLLCLTCAVYYVLEQLESRRTFLVCGSYWATHARSYTCCMLMFATWPFLNFWLAQSAMRFTTKHSCLHLLQSMKTSHKHTAWRHNIPLWSWRIDFLNRCYAMAVKQVSTSSALWHDLGVAYMRRSAHAQVTSDATGARQLMTQAVTCLRKSLSIDSRNAVAWNSLGLAAASKG